LKAIAYAIPARIEEAAGCRIVSSNAPMAGPPLATWPELQALHASGIVDVQCHTYSHSRIFCSDAIVGYVTPEFASTPLLNRPRVTGLPALRFLSPTDLGAPLYAARSRMSDGLCVSIDPDVPARCVQHVTRSGGPAFFDKPSWRTELDAIARDARSHVESAETRRAEIEEELDRGRSVLNDRLRTRNVNHVCLPWGVSGDDTTAALKRLGFASAFANRLPGVHAVKRGDDRYWLKRLPNKYIVRLPGRGRRLWSMS
jgi:hypothetical protein